MPSIFDLLLGQSNPQTAALAPMTPAVPRPPSILDSPDYASERAGDALRGLAAGLVQAGAPSPYPQGFAQVFGAAGMGAGKGMEGSEEKYLKRAMVNAQVQKAEEEIKNEKAWRNMFSGDGPTASAAIPPAAGPVMTAAAPPDPTNPGSSNPGNITNGKGGFQSFPTPEAGVAAAVKLAQSYPDTYNGGQPMSLAQVESKWAPPDNGVDPLTKGNKQGVWSGNVAKVMGVDPNQPIDFKDPAVALKFAQAVHVAEHGPAKLYAPEVYQRGVQLASGGAPVIPQGDAVQSDGAPVVAPGGPPVGPPVQLAQAAPAPGAPPPVAAPPVGPIPPGPAVGGPRSLQDVIATMPPGVRQMVGAMGRKDGMGVIMKYADPETHVAIDSTTGAVVFAPKTDKSGRYVPVDVMKLDIERQNAESQRRQAAAREKTNEIRQANEPLQPPAVPGGPPSPTPGFVEQKGAVTGAEETAKVGPQLLKYQGEEAIKDHQTAQAGAAKARQANNNLTQLSTLLKGIDTGKMTATTQDIKAYAKAAGINLDAMGIKDDVANTQAAQALLSQMALEMRSTGEGGGMPGSMSDQDRTFLASMTPGLATTPEGRNLMVDYQRRLNQRVIDVAAIKNKYMQSDKFATNPAGMWAEVNKFVDSHPLFDPAKDKLPDAAAAPAAAPMSAIDAEIARRKGGK